MEIKEIKKISWIQPVAVVYKSNRKTERIEYFINGKEVQLHDFKRRIKHLSPTKIITKNIKQ